MIRLHGMVYAGGTVAEKALLYLYGTYIQRCEDAAASVSVVVNQMQRTQWGLHHFEIVVQGNQRDIASMGLRREAGLHQIKSKEGGRVHTSCVLVTIIGPVKHKHTIN